ncbi:MAG: flavodoxin domain-containing protein [Thiohalocapsa sp.]
MALSQLTELTSPLEQDQLGRLQQALTGLSPTQVAWVSGYLAGCGGATVTAANTPASVAPPSFTILYGSQTGNTRAVAEALAATARSRGMEPRLVSMADFRSRDISRERLLLILVSTQGEGEPPEAGQDLFNYLHGKRAPRLEGLQFGVLGLGDSSYALFCQAAKAFDARLRALGAQALVDLQCCDLGDDDLASDWSSRALDLTSPLLPVEAKVIPMHSTRPAPAAVDEALIKESAGSGPVSAQLLENRQLTTADAVGEVRHLALSIDPQTLRFTPGDSLGVWFHNDPSLVDAIVSGLELDAEAPVTLANGDVSLRQALTERLELTQLHPGVVKAWADLTGSAPLADLCADAARLRDYAGSRQLIDLVEQHPAAADAAALASILRPLRPRLYSIASSQAEIEDEVHLTVSLLRYQAPGGGRLRSQGPDGERDRDRERLGGASGFLTHRLPEDGSVRVEVTDNPGFRLPAGPDVPIIMVGAGTGVAPFRAFLQQRAAQQDPGRNWLIFGNRHFRRDFLYQSDWQAHRKAGRLTRVSVAFSRDQAEKRYAQHRFLEQGRELYDWLQQGAHLYVCGATGMGRAVQESLLEVIQREAACDRDTALEQIDSLRRDGRYQRDLY